MTDEHRIREALNVYTHNLHGDLDVIYNYANSNFARCNDCGGQWSAHLVSEKGLVEVRFERVVDGDGSCFEDHSND